MKSAVTTALLANKPPPGTTLTVSPHGGEEDLVDVWVRWTEAGNQDEFRKGLHAASRAVLYSLIHETSDPAVESSRVIAELAQRFSYPEIKAEAIFVVTGRGTLGGGFYQTVPPYVGDWAYRLGVGGWLGVLSEWRLPDLLGAWETIAANPRTASWAIRALLDLKPTPYMTLGDVAGNPLLGMQAQYAARYLKRRDGPDPHPGYPDAGQGLRWFGDPTMWHGVIFHKEDAKTFVYRVQAARGQFERDKADLPLDPAGLADCPVCWSTIKAGWGLVDQGGAEGSPLFALSCPSCSMVLHTIDLSNVLRVLNSCPAKVAKLLTQDLLKQREERHSERGPEGWFIEKYSPDFYGLRCTVPHDSRGVPEGTWAEWQAILGALVLGEECQFKRLAYSPHNGITSPRNTNMGNTGHDERFWVRDPKKVAAWIDEQLKYLSTAPEGTRSPSQEKKQ